jgi:hypothetical protein
MLRGVMLSSPSSSIARLRLAVMTSSYSSRAAGDATAGEGATLRLGSPNDGWRDRAETSAGWVRYGVGFAGADDTICCDHRRSAPAMEAGITCACCSCWAGDGGGGGAGGGKDAGSTGTVGCDAYAA